MKTIDWAETAESIKQGWYSFGSIVTVIALIIGGFAAGWFLSSDDQVEAAESKTGLQAYSPDYNWEPESEVEREFKAAMVNLHQGPGRNHSEEEHNGSCRPVSDSWTLGVDPASLDESLEPHLCLHTVGTRTSAYLVQRHAPGTQFDFDRGAPLESSWAMVRVSVGHRSLDSFSL